MYIPCIYQIYIKYMKCLLLFRIVWLPSHLFHITLGIVATATLLRMLYHDQTQTACGLWYHSFSSTVLLAHCRQEWMTVVVVHTTFHLPWSSSEPLRICACKWLAPWSLMEWENCMSPPLLTRSTLGFGHLGAPNLALAVCLWPKRNGSARCPGLRQL